MDCLFCKLIHGEIPSTIVYEDESVIAFNDINPKAPIHQLIIPRQHFATINDITVKDEALVGHMVTTAKHLALEAGVSEKGYRLIFNVNQDAGQEVFHIHLHLLAGKRLPFP